VATVPSRPADLRFRPHTIDAESTFSACAAMDVNRDGRLDVVCGGWWYESPNWTKHFLREVEVIRGRYDDYSNLPLDVNGDGWPDLISANYRSRTLYWIQHPGKDLGAWTTHVVAKPGPMETARVADVDSDGRPDVLPNGTTFAAWWSFSPRKDGTVRWRRHALPHPLAAHGLGCGDIDGDGMNDLVGPRGWARARRDSQGTLWQWQPEFQLHRDAGVPVLVVDVDGDGDADIVWGRAHRTGLYWLEQRREGVRRRWLFHVIDTSWSQPHALLWGDLDGDGRPELVAGKRYLAHEGRDLGEYDPLIVCAYRFDPATHAWSRRVLHVGGRLGFGLDPKLADLDGDGDLDIVCPGRSGLYWLENLRLGAAPSARPGPSTIEAVAYEDHAELLVYKDQRGRRRPVRTPAEWAIRRAHILANMQLVMGPLPDSSQRVPLDVRVLAEEDTPHYVRRKITFAAEPGDRVPAWLLIPTRLKTPAPGMLCLHPTHKLAKDEVAGRGGRPTRQYGHELALRGYVCLVPDYPSFGESAYDFQAHRGRYASGSMKAVWNNVRAIDLLESLPEVDRDRIGCIGHSLGGHNALFTAVFDLRIKAVVTSCGFTAFHHYYDGNLKGWTKDVYMPRIRDVYQSDPDRMPFDFYEVLAAIAPRAVFINAPDRDANFAVVGVRKVVGKVRAVYALLGASSGLHVIYPPCAHDFPDDVRSEAYAWLDRVLGKR
ncbi:MAG TPA: hypothetical protein EYP14_14670, partial [Planctomycetaceae bacterium]|nr:hypothetical protein [Planctomycetaceae bacterium]